MNHILNWKLFESEQENWPTNWRDLPEWKTLEEMGFTGKENKGGSIIIDNPILPGSYLALTKNGYIRRPGVNGYLEHRNDRNLSQMLRLVAIRKQKEFDKYSKSRGQTQKDLDILKKIEGYTTGIMSRPDPISGLTSDQIIILNKYVDGKWEVNSEGIVEINGDLRGSAKKTRSPKILNENEELKKIKFGNISGNVTIKPEIEKLPIFLGIVHGDFTCSMTKLISLEGGPQEVEGNFDCSYNKLTYLEGAPKKVKGNFDCSNNQLTSLKGAPSKVGKNFFCFANPFTTLEGAPKEIGESFSCGGFGILPFGILPGQWGPDAWLQKAMDGHKLAFTLLENPMDQKKLMDRINQELENEGDFEKWGHVFDIPWFKPTPLVRSIYRAWERGM
jgi:hypothetical protein